MLTLEEYLEFEEHSAVRHEYVGGVLHAQAGTSERHSRIALNIAAHFLSAAGDGPCRVVASDVKLQIEADIVYYPDVMVVCDPADTDSHIKTAPSVVVEVLSPSTAGADQREKLMAYRRVPSLQTYLIVAQNEPRVIRNWRNPQGAWWQEELVGEGSILFGCPETELQLGQIYRGITFDSET
jgi:Uma2 family endonuclease